MRKRRRATRTHSRWGARFKAEQHDTWTHCRVLDVSLGGLALELDDFTDRPVGRLLIELQPDGSGSTGGLLLRGEVRNAGRNRLGPCRVGIEFVETSGVERHVLTDLLEAQHPVDRRVRVR